MSAPAVAVARGGARAAKASGRAALLPAKTSEEIKADRPYVLHLPYFPPFPYQLTVCSRVQALYRHGLPLAAYNLIQTFSNRSRIPNQHAPTESTLSPNLDDRIAAANAELDKALGRTLRDPRDTTTWVVQRRGQHVPIGMIARDLKNRFWHRMFKGSRDAAVAVQSGGKKDGEEGVEGK
jgi:hypothetical protein